MKIAEQLKSRILYRVKKNVKFAKICGSHQWANSIHFLHFWEIDEAFVILMISPGVKLAL